MIVMIKRTGPDYLRTSPFGSVTDRRTGPDFRGPSPWGAKGHQGRIQRTGADCETGTVPTYVGRSVPVRWVRPASWGGPVMAVDLTIIF